jgi:hypothetical protein
MKWHTSLRIQQLQRRCSLGYHKIALKMESQGVDRIQQTQDRVHCRPTANTAIKQWVAQKAGTQLETQI